MLSQRLLGLILIVAALGMILSLLAGDVAALGNWGDATDPKFVSGAMAHIGAVFTAAAGGNLVPNVFKKMTGDK